MRHRGFDDMKTNAAGSVQLSGVLGQGGAETFVPQGTNGRSRDELSMEHSVAHERRATADASEECAGRLLTGDLW